MERSPENALGQIVGWCWHCGGRIFTWDEAAVTKAGRLFCAEFCMNNPPTPAENPELF